MDWSLLNWVDWLFIATLLYGAAMGAVRGLSHELATLIGMGMAGLVTRMFYEPVSAWICEHWGWNPEITRLASVVVLALLALFGMRMVRIALGALMTFAFKGLVERLGGLVAGLFRQGITFLVLMLAASFIPSNWLYRAMTEQSQVGKMALPVLVEEYNTLAQKAALLQAEIPVGVELPPEFVMPPEPDPGTGVAIPMWNPE